MPLYTCKFPPKTLKVKPYKGKEEIYFFRNSLPIEISEKASEILEKAEQSLYEKFIEK